ncbi:MAG TPA: rhomboid family intramembrane serine protease [Rhizomicrobium sp.]
MRIPVALTLLLAALIAAHALRVFGPAWLSNAILTNCALVPARYDPAWLAAHAVDAGSWIEQALPFVGYAFVHANWEHLGLNCIWLLPFGTAVARRLGPTLFLLLFLICAIAGAALHIAVYWGSESPVIGASAAVSGMMGAAFRMMLTEPGEALAPLLSRRILIWSVVWLGMNLVAGVLGLGTDQRVQIVAWEAHMGGYFAGLLLIGPLDALRRRHNAPTAA